MDKVRFGRALGYGARHAAKAMVKAVDAATSPDPGAKVRSASGAGASVGTGSGAGAARVVVAAERMVQAHQAVKEAKAQAVRQVATEVRGQAGTLGRSMWSPFARLSGVLWLEVTGTFFAVMAAYLSQGLWRQRGAVLLGAGAPDAIKFYLHLAAFLVFLYFAVSSFVRARKRGRRA